MAAKMAASRADHWAGMAAAESQIPDTDKNLVDWIDATAWIIQRRLLAVDTKFTVKKERTAKDNSNFVKVNKLDLALSEAGHQIERIGTHKQVCVLCHQSWPLKTRAAVIALGHCPGPELWGPAPTNPHLPHRAPIGAQIVLNGNGLDPSHRLAWHRGVIFCWRCGAYSTGGRVGNLIRLCPPKPTLKQGRQLGLIRQGKSPTPDGVWPLPEDEFPPGQFRSISQARLVDTGPPTPFMGGPRL